MTILEGQFDIHIDSNHRWDTDRVMEIDVYPMVQNLDGTTATDTQTTLASVRIPAQDISLDTWIDSTDQAARSELPTHIRTAYLCVIIIANAVQKEMNN